MVVIPSTKQKFYIEKLRADPSFKGAVGEAKEVAQHLNKREKFEKVKICKESIVFIPIVIYMKLDSHFQSSIDKTLRYVIPSGLIDFWHSPHINADDESKEVFITKPINLLQFRGCIFILLIGWSSSLIALIAETRIQRVKSWNYVNASFGS